MDYTYEQLTGKTVKELEAIKEEKQNELYEIKKGKFTLISNIISLQEMAKMEIVKETP